MTIFFIGANSALEDDIMYAKQIPEGNLNLVTLNNAIADIMNRGYLSPSNNIIPSKFAAVPSISMTKIVIRNDHRSFELITDKHILSHIYSGWDATTYPLNSKMP